MVQLECMIDLSDLTPVQQKFVQKENLPLKLFFDAKSWTKKVKDYQEYMRQEGFYFAINPSIFKTICKENTVKDRSRHCVICHPKQLGWVKQILESDKCYIFGSLEKQLIKIGSCKTEVKKRLTDIKAEKQGGTDDWIVLFYINYKKAFYLEREIGKKIGKYNYFCTYIKDKKEQTSREIFKCSYKTAKNALDESVKDLKKENPDLEFEEKIFVNNESELYNFPNVEKIVIRNSKENIKKP